MELEIAPCGNHQLYPDIPRNGTFKGSRFLIVNSNSLLLAEQIPFKRGIVMKKNSKQIFKKKWYLFMLPIIFPIIVSQFIRLPFGNWTIGGEDSWVSFFGSYLGGIIGGLITLYVFKKTIDNQSEIEKRLRSEQEELRKLSIRPYFTARIVHSIDHNEYVFETAYLPLTEEIFEAAEDISFIKLENVGMGNAVGIKFYADAGYYMEMGLDPVALKVGGSMVVHLNVLGKLDGDIFTMKLRYTDLLGNPYNQVIKLLKQQGKILVLSVSEPIPIKEFGMKIE
ncbi:hypothetical protein D3P07_15335 [Paenibacillus sp. 1011MAR3C5]|uniref:hypothetical protein n=1 Tax=Paenibacillus sp. 1011MAR3C5 TaxID=1675787 RepID=UPI000E6B75AC|nr:hypothetical protein [Paenibacillus sp. 1011MAR3C5]RJE87679.1 hypothetical protein D3P07_15335 [Paenibacillus sp. 1011MAR3C5]